MTPQQLHDKHMVLIDKVNKYTDPWEKQNAEIALRAWRDGLEDAGVNVGRMLICADLCQIERGNNFNMCGGVFNLIGGKPVPFNGTET
jgi:hypothetical protein